MGKDGEIAYIDTRIFRLHYHWLIADSVKEALGCYISKTSDLQSLKDMPEEIAKLSKLYSVFNVQKVYYALLYVVIEEYPMLNIGDHDIDSFLADEEKVRLLKRFRNAIFHAQKDIISPKEMDFLDIDWDGDWIKGLNKAFSIFFETYIKAHPLPKIKKPE